VLPLSMWRWAYKTTQLVGGRSRLVLRISGHIAGIVNAPNRKANHWTNDAHCLPTPSYGSRPPH